MLTKTCYKNYLAVARFFYKIEKEYFQQCLTYLFLFGILYEYGKKSGDNSRASC